MFPVYSKDLSCAVLCALIVFVHRVNESPMKRNQPTNERKHIMKTTNQTANKYARAAIEAKFIGPTNTKPARIKVSTQRGSKIYGYHNLPGEAGSNSAYDAAVAEFLAHIEKEDQAKYGPDSKGWGKLSDYAVGVTMDEVRVYVNVKN